jgi:hypothetical protein
MPTIRGTGLTFANAASVAIPFPAGTLAGDLAIIFPCGGFAATLPTGWTQNDNQTGSFWDGATFSKILTGADISTGSVAVAFSGSFNIAAGIITIVLGPGEGFKEVVAIRAGSNPQAVTTSGKVGAADLLTYWGSNRAVSVNTVNRGTQRQQANDGSAAAGCIYTETGALGPVTAVFSYTVSGSGNYQSVVDIGTPASLNMWSGPLPVGLLALSMEGVQMPAFSGGGGGAPSNAGFISMGGVFA